MPSTKLIHFVKKYALEMLPDGDYIVLKSGKPSNYYIDCRKLTLTPAGLNCVVREFAHSLQPIQCDAVGGPSIGADPIIGGLCFHADSLVFRNYKRCFLVRSEEKAHGKAGRIVGQLQKSDRCVIIEDVTTTGSSALSAIEAVKDFGAEVVHVLTIVDRLQGASDLFAAKGIPFTPLLTVADLGL